MNLFKQLLFSFLLIASYASAQSQNDISSDLEKLEIFLSSLNAKYVDSVNTYDLVESAIKNVLRDLDPHSIYLNKEVYQSTTEQLNGRFNGLGIRYQMVDDTMTILEVYKGSGAEKAGIRMGDQMIAAGNDTLSGLGQSSRELSEILEANALLNEGITIWRKSGKEQDIVYVDRLSISVSSVPAAFMIDQEIGYIKLSKFTDKSFDDVKSALEKLKKAKVEKLIFDIRGNSGGYLTRAIKIADEFLEDRRLIVYTQGVHQSKRETFATSGGRFTEGDLVILIDEHSASASEIFAGAIQDWDRGLIIGRRSYGKGLVQRPIEFGDGSAMRMTISRYYTPTGRSIQQPYSEGYDAYRNAHKHRRQSGELLDQDSIQIADSLVYFTPKNRKVYGGGGIIPDLFVSEDTSKYTAAVSQLLRQGLSYGFVLKIVAIRGDEIAKGFKDANDYVLNFQVDAGLYVYFQNYIANRVDFEIDWNDLNTELQIKRHLKTLIARFAFDMQAYYRAQLEFDVDVLAAREALEKDKLQELGLK
jgi:carboxyl-terminal processing protease